MTPGTLAGDLDESFGEDPSIWEALRDQRIFLTGGTGFFGCWLLESYLHAWDRLHLGGGVTVLTRDPARFIARAPHLATHSAVTLHRGDQATFQFPAQRVDAIIHAALALGDPLSVLEDNLAGLRRVLLLARTAGTKRVLFTSSGAVYGKQPADVSHVTEEHLGAPPLNATGAYGETKRIGELMGTLWGDAAGHAFLIARCFAFVGPYLPLDGAGAMGNFLKDAMAGGPLIVRGDGRPIRSYLYGGDLARWLWTILLRGQHGRPYNVGSEEGHTVAEVASRVRDVLAPGAEVRVQGQPDEHDLRARYLPSTRRARLELGLRQTVTLTDAISRSARFFGAHTIQS